MRLIVSIWTGTHTLRVRVPKQPCRYVPTKERTAPGMRTQRRLEYNIEFFFLCAPAGNTQVEPAVAAGGKHGGTAVSSLSPIPNEAASETPHDRAERSASAAAAAAEDADRLAGERVRDGGGGGVQ